MMDKLVKLFWWVWNFWFKLPDKLRYFLVGGFNACVQYILYILFLLLFGLDHPQTALILSWILSTFSSFATQKIFVFCTKGTFRTWVAEYLKCLGVWVTSYLINAGVLELLIRVFGIHPYGAQIIALSCTTISGYLLFKYFAFKH